MSNQNWLFKFRIEANYKVWDFELTPEDMELFNDLNVGWRHLLWAETSGHKDYPFKRLQDISTLEIFNPKVQPQTFQPWNLQPVYSGIDQRPVSRGNISENNKICTFSCLNGRYLILNYRRVVAIFKPDFLTPKFSAPVFSSTNTSSHNAGT